MGRAAPPGSASSCLPQRGAARIIAAMRAPLLLGATALLALAASACSSSSAGSTSTGAGGHAATADAAPPDYDDPSVGYDDAAVAELRAHGYDKYLGKFQPSDTSPTDTATYYTFAPDTKGPICMNGTAFAASIRPGTTDDLLIYLQGGGACWTGTCMAVTGTSGGPWPVGWTDGDVEKNPLGAFPLLTVGYCDGSVFAGDGEVADKENGAPDGVRYHHGLANLSAALDVGKRAFPSPRRIVLVGSSAGGYGTILSTMVVRLLWPHTHLFVISDAGPGLTNPKVPSMYETMVKEWNLGGRIPPSCTACENGQFLPLVGWSLQHDPTLRAGLFESYGDDVVSHDFLSMTGGAFRTLLLSESGAVHDAYPTRYERFFITGTKHTALLAGYYDVRAAGQSLPDWTKKMIDGDAGWKDALEPTN